MTESSGLVLALSSKSIVYDIPEHPPCLTPILKHKSSFRSHLILFKCFSALSVSEIAGARAPDAGAAERYWASEDEVKNESVQTIYRLKRGVFHRLKRGVFYIAQISNITKFKACPQKIQSSVALWSMILKPEWMMITENSRFFLDLVRAC